MAWGEFEQSLCGVLGGEISVEGLVRQGRLPLGGPTLPARQPPRVMISNTESDFYTLVDVIADDRIGLLYDVTRCLGEHGLEIYISKAATIKDQVTDTFYLKGPGGRKLRDSDALERLEEDLLAAARLDDDADQSGSGRRPRQ